MKRKTDRIHSLRAGFTLVEVSIVTLLLAVVLGSVALVSGSSGNLYRDESVRSHLEAQAALALQRVCDELLIAGADTFTPALQEDIGAPVVQYVQATDVVGTVVQWTPLRRLELELEPGELDDGLDNNGNGLVDEGRLVLVEDVGGAGERRRVLTRWVADHLEGELENGVDDNGNGLVDERGFSLERQGRTIVVRLTLERVTSTGALLRRSAESSVRPRNVQGGGS